MLNYKKLINGIATGSLLLSFLTGCKQPEPTPITTISSTVASSQTATVSLTETVAPTATVENTPTPTLEQRVEETATSKLAFVASDEEYAEDIWILDGNQVKRMTHNLNDESYLTWSLDGETLFYLSEGDSTRKYKSLDVETGEIREIFDIEHSVSSLKLSPEGNLLAYVESYYAPRDGTSEFVERLSVFDIKEKKEVFSTIWNPRYYLTLVGWSDQDNELILLNSQELPEDLYEFNFLTENLRQIYPNVGYHLELSSDGNHLLFRDEGKNEEDYLYLMDLDSQNITELGTPITSYEWLSDGRFMYFLNEEDNPQMYLVDGGKKNPVLDDEIMDFFIGMGNILPSPQGNNIVFSGRHASLGRGYFLANLKTNDVRKIDFGQEYPFFSNMDSFVWSPGQDPTTYENLELVDEFDEDLRTINPIDEKALFVLVDRYLYEDVWTLEGDNLVRLTNKKDREISSIDEAYLSPDGEKIIVTQSGYIGDNNYEVHIMDSDGGNLETLTVFKGFVFDAHWFPDGDKLSFLVFNDEEETRDLFVYDLERDEKELLLENVENYDLSPDGTEFLIATEGRIYNYNLEFSGEVKTVFGNFTGDELVKYSPTGEQILVSSEDPFNNWLYVGEDILNLKVVDEDFFIGASWSQDGENIVYTTRDENSCEIMVSNKDGSEKRVVLQRDYQPDNRNYCYSSPVFSPRGETIMYTLGISGREYWSNQLFAVNIDGTDNRRIPFSFSGLRLDFFEGHFYEFFPGE